MMNVIYLLLVLLFWEGMALCETFGRDASGHGGGHSSCRQDNKLKENMIKITVGSSTFTAVLADNAAAKAFSAMLPLTIRMDDINGNEKYGRLSGALPAAASCPGTIYSGDLMLWGSEGLVLFYKTFSTSYSYTRIGRIDDASALAGALRSEKETVTFELK